MLLPLVAIGFVTVVLVVGIFLLVKNVKNKLLLYSALIFNAGISIWQILLIVMSRIADTEFLHRIAFASAIWGMFGAVGLALLYPNVQAGRKIKSFFQSASIASGVIALLFMFSKLIITTYELPTETVVFTPFGKFVLAMIAVEFVTIIAIFIYRYYKEVESRFYFKYIAFFFSVTVVILSITNFLMPLLGDTSLNEYGSLVALIPQLGIIYTLGLGYINKLSYIIYKVARTLILVVLEVIFFILGVKILEVSFNYSIELRSVIFFSFYFLAVFLSINWVRQKLDDAFDDLGWVGKMSPSNARNEYAKQISKKVSLRDTVTTTRTFLKNVFEVEKLKMILWSEDGETLYIDDDSVENEGDLKELYERKSREIERNENIFNVISLYHKDREKYEKYYGTIAYIPKGYGFYGVILFGNKYNYEPFTGQDIQALQNVIELMRTSINRSILHGKVEQFNDELREKVREATKQLDEQLVELRATRKRERDMIDIIGHELRTPLSIIRVSLELMEKKASRISTAKKNLGQYMDRIKEALEREIRLLESMLSSTKIESENMDLHFEKVDIDQIINDSILAVRNKVSKKKLKIEYKPVKKPLYVYADKIRIGEVVDNFVTNAVKYTEKGTITITTDSTKEYAAISVKDTGIGIPKEDIPHLGEKFYRVGQYTTDKVTKKVNKKKEEMDEEDINLVRPGGSGLGLFVSYNLVNLMGGVVDVQSTVGKGSTFSFTVPVYGDQPETYRKKDDRNIFSRLGFTRKGS